MTDLAGPATTARDDGYRVLARKYRPQTFAELIGQDAMVRTLANAIASGRLAHAFILTGVRGVGKTSTARLIARALNCVGPDGKGGPTVAPCGQCEPCRSIADSRHVDVLEMDAASRTGVEDIREIIEGVRYSPVSARYKIYIIDEVHMLSRNAFNALLKTLEEPPPHVKFIFATTEIRKVPVTVLSRCQRFDLKRVETRVLIEHFRAIAKKENAEIDDAALALIARAAEGSVRDGLSLLDQAIAHGGGVVDEAQVRDMLGLADRAQVLDLYRAIMAGEVEDALSRLRSQYDQGADPLVVLQDLLELTHWVTRLKVAPDAGSDVAVSEAERTLGGEFARDLSIPVLTRTWQMLLKGLEEVRAAPSPIAAAEMIIVRLAHVADLPSPAELARRAISSRSATPAPGRAASSPPARGGGETSAVSVARSAPMAAPESAPTAYAEPQRFADVVALFETHREMRIAQNLTDNVHLVRFAPGRLEVRLKPEAPADLLNKVTSRLKEWTGRPWIVSLSQDDGEATLHDQEQAMKARLRAEIERDPLVRDILAAFPGAEITDIRDRASSGELEEMFTPEGSDVDAFGLDD